MKQTTHLDGEALKELLLGGLSNLQLHKEEVDALNVFPVPDGDTGTNMSMTLEGGAAAVEGSYFEGVSDLMKAYARGTLLSARGNSGVILSQFIKGLETGLSACKTASTADFCAAFEEGMKKAYEAVLNPTEGTMLTVMKDGSACLLKEQPASFEALFAAVNARMRLSLDNTPALLPVLKEAGVIDSGGAGFLYFFEGMETALCGGELRPAPAIRGGKRTADFSAFTADSTLEFGYCTEFILQLQNAKVDTASFDKQNIVAFLEQHGDSIVAVQEEDLIKIHVHTFRPGEVLNFCQQFGEFLTVKIENMSVQHNEIFLEEERKTQEKIRKPIAVVAALSGPGLKACFSEIGVDLVVEGGQTENPSAEDFLAAFRRIEADHILVLPCNSNIVMTASQAADMLPEADIRVVKAKTVAEGYAALSMMNLSLPVEEIIRDMEQAIAETETGFVTTATRDVEYPGLKVKKGHFIGLNGERVVSDSTDRVEAARALLAEAKDLRDKAVLVIFYGTGVEEAERTRLEQVLRAEFPWLEYGFIGGGQEVYDYIFAIE